MKKDRIIYWSCTALVCGVMAFSVVNFNLVDPLGPPEASFAHLGLPDYIRIELTIAKSLGILALLLPGVSRTLRGFAYAGFAITLASAAFAHYSIGDGIMFVIDPLIFLGVLAVSYRYLPRVRPASHGAEDAPALRRVTSNG